MWPLRWSACARAAGVSVADSGFGYLRRLCAADAGGHRLVVPLRADTGWAHWFSADLPAA